MASCTSFLSSFGRLPEGQRLERIKSSAHYADGEFGYPLPTTLWSGDAGGASWLKEAVFGSQQRLRPEHPLPMLATDLGALQKDKDVVIWLGHSSYFIQIGGKRILIDPVFSAHASPLPFLYRAFDGDYPYSAANMPDVDYVLISHDHWDHLDYPTLTALKPKVKAVVTPLGVGSHLERWGYAPDRIHEADWYEQVSLEPGITIHVLPARHFSGRGLRSNQTLWAGFLLATPDRKLFYSGDGGYGPHFAEIGRRFGGIDLAIIENGQYDPRWARIHMLPEDAVQAVLDLRAKALLPAHSGRFALASHAWDDPYQRISSASQGRDFKLLTPMIGQLVDLDKPDQAFARWWERTDLLPSTAASSDPARSSHQAGLLPTSAGRILRAHGDSKSTNP